MSESMADRFAKLRSLRETLCKKEKNWQSAFEAKDWIAEQLNILLAMVRDQNTTCHDLENRIEDILCVLDPDNNKEIDDDE